MFEATNEGIRLPHPKLSLRLHLVVEVAICAAWTLMTNRGRVGFDLQTANEDTVTHELYERLYDEVFDKGVVGGFDRQVFASIRREPKVRNFDGRNPDKMPDLLVEFIDRPAGVMNSQHGLFIECKPVDRKHPAGSAYCDEGLIRFTRGDYAWAMQSAMMVGYARGGLFPCPQAFRGPGLQPQRTDSDLVWPGVLSTNGGDGVCRAGRNFQAPAHVHLRRERPASGSHRHPPPMAEARLSICGQAPASPFSPTGSESGMSATCPTAWKLLT